MPKKDPKDSHRVITRAERKARKEHESAANIAGAKATGEAGNERDRLANEVPEVEATVSIEEHIEAHSSEEPSVTKASEVTEYTIDPEGQAKAVAKQEEVAESIPDEAADDNMDEIMEAIDEAQSDTAEELEEAEKAQEQLSELEKQIAELEARKAALEKE